MPFTTGQSLKSLLPPARIDPRPRPEKQMTFADFLVHKAKELAGPVTGRINHWLNDPIVQAQQALFVGGPLATVWHGSPHKFSKFDMSKIGTGEGAQAYGHGLYFADQKDTAKSYASMLKDTDQGLLTVRKGDEILAQGSNIDDAGLEAIKALDAGRKQAGVFTHNIGYYAKQHTKNPKVSKLIDAWQDAKIDYEPFGENLYKVDLPDESIAKMLDWDKPLSEQPKPVKQFIDNFKPLKKKVAQAIDSFGADNVRGKNLHTFIREFMGDAHFADSHGLAEQTLKTSNIPGIKYLDQGSRGSGKGTYNYVVFDDTLPKILEINGVPMNDLPFKAKK